jgi:TPP-dependent pyruvate/acetoin dehydrogenase alpha subunit
MPDADTPGALPRDPAGALALLERMQLLRAFEEEVAELHARGQVAGLVHLAIGQEATAVAIAAAARRTLAGSRPRRRPAEEVR